MPKNPAAVALGSQENARAIQAALSQDEMDRKWAAAKLGSMKSKKKAQASRENGKKGGRPVLCGYQASFPGSRGCTRKAIKDGYCEAH